MGRVVEAPLDKSISYRILYNKGRLFSILVPDTYWQSDPCSVIRSNLEERHTNNVRYFISPAAAARRYEDIGSQSRYKKS